MVFLRRGSAVNLTPKFLRCAAKIWKCGTLAVWPHKYAFCPKTPQNTEKIHEK